RRARVRSARPAEKPEGRARAGRASRSSGRGATVAMGESAETGRFARFVSLACHDLRTPLATLHGFARTLARGKSLDETQARYVTMLEEATAQRAEPVHSLALVAQIEGGRYHPVMQPADPVGLAEAAAHLIGDD